MEFSLDFGGFPQDLTITLRGVADALGARRLATDLAADPRFRPGLLILVDVTDLDTATVDDNELYADATAFIERDAAAAPGAVAIVAPDGDTFIKATHYRAYLGGSKSRREVFIDREDAIAWLRSQRR